jgi:hypothetical protein
MKWLRHAWHVPVAFVVGYFTLYGLHGWSPSPGAPNLASVRGVDDAVVLGIGEPARGDIVWMIAVVRNLDAVDDAGLVSQRSC